MARKKLPPLADERPQLKRWIGVAPDGTIYGTTRDKAHGVELSEPYSDEIPPVPAHYWRGRKGPPKP